MVDVAFILAASHSGSTLLALLLGSQKGATTVGDTAGTSARSDPDYRCSCGRRSRECPFWKKVGQSMSARGLDFDVADFGTRFHAPESRFVDRVLRAEHRGTGLENIRDTVLRFSRQWQVRKESIMRRNVALAEVVTSIQDARILVDSSKLPHRAKFLLQIPDLRVKIVRLVRDGRGVVDTYVKDNGWSARKSAIEWKRGLLAEQHLIRTLSAEQWIQVRYEDLCANPPKELQALCRFLELDSTNPNLSFRTAGHHAFGNKMRLSDISTIQLDDRWKTDLTQADLAAFEQVAGQENREYGFQ